MQLSARPTMRGPALAKKQRTAAPLRLNAPARGATIVPSVAAIQMPAVEQREFARKPVRLSAHRIRPWERSAGARFGAQPEGGGPGRATLRPLSLPLWLVPAPTPAPRSPAPPP